MSAELPRHLRKYIVEQNERKYTPVDHAVWRFVLRQLKSYLSVHAHDAYLDGLSKTGIEIERIPKISDISAKIEKFGWRALPVSGFIPPAAFMELQSLGVLPVASDIRSLDHLLYTPAPDIVHEAAGHAPLLAHPEFADYLTRYAKVARKALISKEDMDLYEAIRDLSDLKENPSSTPGQIDAAEKNLERVGKAVSHVSEATWLSRMNWWTAEYGLFGSLEKPRIYGAGLLSSVGESRWCLSPKVKKIPMSIECIDYGYDITEPQPQLFVTPDFATLNRVLDELAERMAFRRGGLDSVKKAIQSATVNTVELSSGLQISGKCVAALTADDGTIAYLKFEGPSQLSTGEKQLPGHGKDYHAHGYGTAVGFLKGRPGTCPSDFSEAEWRELGAMPGGRVRLEYASGVTVAGTFKELVRANGKAVVLALTDAEASFRGETLFQPAWGVYDLGLGCSVPSVFGGPADREAYGEVDDFVAARVPTPKFSAKDLKRHQAYQWVREWRENSSFGADLDEKVRELLPPHAADFPGDWLIVLEIYELLLNRRGDPALTAEVKGRLEGLMRSEASQADVIRDGMALANRI